MSFNWFKKDQPVEKTKLAVKLKEALDLVTSRGGIRKKNSPEYIAVNLNDKGNFVITLGLVNEDIQNIELDRDEMISFVDEVEKRLK